MTSPMKPATTSAAAEDFEALGLLQELQDADCVDLFADVFRDAANLEPGDQVLLEALDWLDDDAAFACAAAAEENEPVKTVSFSAAAPSAASAPAASFAPSPVASFSQTTTTTTYKSLTSQIAVVAPCFNLATDAMPSLMMMPTLPVAAPASTAAAAAAVGVADFAEFDMHKLDTRARRQMAIARWKEKRKRRNFAEKQRFPEYDCRRKVANRRPRVNGRFIREQPVYVSISELQATHQL